VEQLNVHHHKMLAIQRHDYAAEVQ